MRIILLCLFTALLAGCNQSPPPASELKSPAPAADRLITGQVFITQRNGLSVKLGSVEVAVVEFNEGAKHIDSVRQQAVLRLATVRSNAMTCAQQASKLREFRDSELKSLRTAQSNTSNSDALKPFIDRVRLANERLSVAERDLETQNFFEDEQLSAMRDASLAFKTNWPGLLRTTSTDADGNFKVSVPAGRQVLLVASAKRLVLNKTERFGWAETVGPNSTSEVRLSNRNMLNLAE